MKKIVGLHQALILALLVGFVLAGCARKALSERPPRGAEPPSFSTQPSTIGARVKVPMAEMQALIDAELPSQFSGSGDGGDACTRVLFSKVCVGTRYDFEIHRQGSAQIAAAGSDMLRLTLPLSFSGHVGFRGDGAKRLHLDARPFEGGLLLNAELTPRINADWCPKFDLQISYAWTSDPRVEIMHGLWVDVHKPVQAKLDAKLPELTGRVQNAIDCSKFKARLAELYGSKTFAVDVLNAGTEHLNVRPTSLAFSGLSISPRELSAALSLTANVEIAPQALTPAPLPLPPLQTIPAAAPRMTVALPVRVSYSLLSTAIGHALVGRHFAQNTPAGAVDVRVKGVEVYPSNGQLVVGINMAATAPGLVPNTQGEIYLIAKPTIEDGSRIILADAHYAAVLDSLFWQSVSAVFEDQIKADIRRAAVFDLGPQLAKGKASIAASLARTAADSKLAITLSDVDFKLGRVAVADQELAVEGLLSASVLIEAHR